VQSFLNDLEKIYRHLQQSNQAMQEWFGLLKDENHAAAEVIFPLLEKIGLEKNNQNTMAMLSRVVNLRDDGLDQVLKSANFSPDAIIEKKEIIYNEVATIHLQKHRQMIRWIKQNELLTPFYRCLIEGVHEVGVALSGWQSSWTAHIVNGINKELLELFEGDEAKVIDMLHQKNLFDRCGDENSDRCYSVLINENGEYKRVAYAKAFADEVAMTVSALQTMIANLNNYEDEVFGQKTQWLEYLEAIQTALLHTNPDELVHYWANVDEKWMGITTPLQIGHPLEYYEDHFRKAVALEWDLRIVNPKYAKNDTLQRQIKDAALQIFDNPTLHRNFKQIDKTKLYVGQSLLYYGAEFNGLFSAQVVPNDENVSSRYGKKIFAFADFVLQSQRAKPTLKITQEIFGKEYVQQRKEFLHTQEKLWHEIYVISTIGHEYGHILWLDDDTESKMNQSGQFKNIEEFKATCGGLITFFYNENKTLIKHLIDDTVSRAVGLMAWKDVGEVRPYYVEGLLHLHLLFNSGVVTFDGAQVQVRYENYADMKALYIQTYEQLAKHYLDKKDAKAFLEHYVDVKNKFIPKDKSVEKFTEYFQKLYKSFGQEVIL
jgi:hypothetical protein